MQSSVWASKLHIPSPRPELVPRPHLTEQLNAAPSSGCKLSLISAPAGFGKTTLVSEWVHNLRSGVGNANQEDDRIAWLSLDESDNELSRFIYYFIAALQMVDGSVGQMAQAVFQSQQQLLVEPILMTIVNEIAQLSASGAEKSGKGFAVILDDYHVITEQAIHNAIEFLLEHQPPQMHLTILTRVDPPLPLSRYRARNQMVEIRGSNLHFTTKEVDVFLNEIMKLDLAPDEMALLETRTEGWIAGLQLAASSLRGEANRDNFIQTFSGDDRHVIDFLIDEVLLRQPKDIQYFLLQTSVLDDMCGSLCDAVASLSDEPSSLDGQGFLEYLDRENLFIVPMDNQRKWYRYHNLFSDVLRHRLKRTELPQIRELHLRASEWYEKEGYHDQALHQVLAAGDLAGAARIVEQNALRLLTRSNLTMLKKWLKSLPKDLICSRPWLCIYQGWMHFLVGTLKDAGQCVQDAKRLLDSASPQERTEAREGYGHISIIEAHIALKNRQLPVAIELARQTLAYVGERTPVHGHVAVIEGIAAYWDGDLASAEQALGVAVSVAQECDHMFMAVDATIWLGHIKTLQGRLHQAVGHYRDALRLASLDDKRELPIAGSAYIGLSLVEREWNNLAAAESLLWDGYQMCSLFGNLRPWHIAMARVKRAQGHQGDAFDELQIAEQMEAGPDVAFADLSVGIERLCLLLSPVEGNMEEAVQWAEDSGLNPDSLPSFSQRIANTKLARVLMAQDQMGKASELLTRLRDDADNGGRNGDLIEILALQALALQAQEDIEQALTTLETALSLAESEGFIRIFVDEGPQMARLLYGVATRGIAADYTRQLLSAFPVDEAAETDSSDNQAANSELVEPLSERELEVIQLIAEGLTNDEIGSRLFVSMHTVKAHTRNIYAKLDVHTRTQAVCRARAFGILPSK